MLHGVFSVIRIEVLNVAESTSVLRMKSVCRELDVLDLSVAAEDLDDVLLGDVPGQTTDVNARRTRCRRLLASSTDRV